MRIHTFAFTALFCCLALQGCLDNPTDPGDTGTLPVVITAKDLAGTYTGVLEGVTVQDIDTLDDPATQTIVDIDLLHKVTMTDLGGLLLNIESSVIPKTRAVIFGVEDVAINLEFVSFDGLFDSQPNVEVKNIAFVKYDGEWIFVMQLARVGGTGEVYVYQYVSYPSDVAQQMSEDDAIVWVNTILTLYRTTHP